MGSMAPCFDLPRFPLIALLGFVIGCGAPADGDGENRTSTTEWPVHTVCATSSTTIEGIDVSAWQESIDWARVAESGKVFAFIRVSHGTETIDSYFEQNWAGAKANNIIRGVYQYWEPAEDPVEQADILINRINAVGGLESTDLPPVIDIESIDNATSAETVANATTWIERVETALQRRVIVYTGSYFWDDHELGVGFSQHPLWGPNYTSAACPLISDAWDQWTFWQYSSTGSVSGISGNVDLDKFDGTISDLQQFVLDSSLAPPTPDAGPDSDAAEEPEATEPDTADTAVVDIGAEGDEPVEDATTEPETGSEAKGFWSAGEEPSGCACEMAGNRGSGAGILALLGFMLCFVRRRHRAGLDRMVRTTAGR